MAARGAGKILFTSAVAGIKPTPLEAVYGASKAFILSFSKSLRYELKDTGITVTTLQPGTTDTRIFPRAGMEDTEVGSEGKYTNDPAEVAEQGFRLTELVPVSGIDEIPASFKVPIEYAPRLVGLGTMAPPRTEVARPEGQF